MVGVCTHWGQGQSPCGHRRRGTNNTGFMVHVVAPATRRGGVLGVHTEGLRSSTELHKVPPGTRQLLETGDWLWRGNAQAQAALPMPGHAMPDCWALQ